MSMVIGSNSKNTILEVLQIGVREVVKKMGLPEEVTFDAGHAKLVAKSSNFNQKIDFLRIDFAPKNGVDPNTLKAQLEAAKIPNQVVLDNGHCKITLPSFEWRQLPQLMPVDKLVVEHAAESVR